MSENVIEPIVSDDGMWVWDGVQWNPSALQLEAQPAPVAVDPDLDPTEYTGSHREQVVFDREKWRRDREHLQVAGAILTKTKEREDRDMRVPLIVGVAVLGVAVVAGVIFALVSLIGGGAEHGEPEDAVRAWHNSIVSGDAAGSCAYVSPNLFADTADATGESPSCLAVAEIASTTAQVTGGGVIESVDMGQVDLSAGTASAEVTYTDTKSAVFGLSLDADRGWLISSMDGGPGDLLTVKPDALTAPESGEAAQAEELLADMEAGDE